jgi:PAP2 superfamily
MKNRYKIIVLFIAANFISCEKDIVERNEQYEPLNPINTDANAGTWKPILLTKPDEFLIAAPTTTNSEEYKNELAEIKNLQANLTNDQENSIKYWSAGGILRWNEILQTLVAKYNLPPYQNSDGTYPIPNKDNPFAYPQFPFSNPPYAARAYAYVSAAQFDALIAAYHYKKLYRKSAPYANDNDIDALVPKNGLPSYPSEDAAIVGATVEMMKLLFPTEVDFIAQKANEHKRYRLLAGANVRSDITAGELLGKNVASKFVARAKTDGAGAAVGDAAFWAQLESDAIAKGETPWKSLELPPRPPMLPKFGKVQSFFITPEEIIANRPSPPPSTQSAAFLEQLNEVKNFAKNPSREQIRIVSFWADGVGTYTPSGHWNAIADRYFVDEKYSEVRWARNLALLNITMMDAAISCWEAKYFYFYPRPSQMDTSIKTTTGCPNFPAYVSGHSTFSAAASVFLSHLIPSKATAFEAMAKEASDSRLFGAIHYRSDCEKGLELGKKVGLYAVNRAKIDGAE